jgi:hypothetical protein
MQKSSKEEEAPVVNVVGRRLTMAFSSGQQLDGGDHLKQRVHQKDVPRYTEVKGWWFD